MAERKISADTTRADSLQLKKIKCHIQLRFYIKTCGSNSSSIEPMGWSNTSGMM